MRRDEALPRDRRRSDVAPVQALSRQEGLYVHIRTRAVAEFSPWSLLQPLAEQSFYLFVLGFGVTASKILTHDIEPGLEQVQRHAERIVVQRGGGGCPWLVPARSKRDVRLHSATVRLRRRTPQVVTPPRVGVRPARATRRSVPTRRH